MNFPGYYDKAESGEFAPIEPDSVIIQAIGGRVLALPAKIVKVGIDPTRPNHTWYTAQVVSKAELAGKNMIFATRFTIYTYLGKVLTGIGEHGTGNWLSFDLDILTKGERADILLSWYDEQEVYCVDLTNYLREKQRERGPVTLPVPRPMCYYPEFEVTNRDLGHLSHEEHQPTASNLSRVILRARGYALAVWTWVRELGKRSAQF